MRGGYRPHKSQLPFFLILALCILGANARSKRHGQRGRPLRESFSDLIHNKEDQLSWRKPLPGFAEARDPIERLRLSGFPPILADNYASLVRKAWELERDGVVVLASTDTKYQELAANWMVAYGSATAPVEIKERARPQHPNSTKVKEGFNITLYPPWDRCLMYCMDNASHAYLSQFGIERNLVQADFAQLNSTVLSALRTRKLAMFSLIGSGLSVIFSDIDALWLRNVGQYVLDLGVEVAAQRGSFPPELGRVWGSTLNSGLIYLKATLNTIELTRRWGGAMEVNPEFTDQVGLNRAINTGRIRWNDSLPMKYRASCNMSYGTGTDPDMQASVGLVPHHYFQRHCLSYIPRWKVYMMHCRTTKLLTCKVQSMIANKIWFLPWHSSVGDVTCRVAFWR